MGGQQPHVYTGAPDYLLYLFGGAMFGVMSRDAEHHWRHASSAGFWWPCILAAIILYLCLHYGPPRFAPKRKWFEDAIYAILGTVLFVAFLIPTPVDPGDFLQ